MEELSHKFGKPETAEVFSQKIPSPQFSGLAKKQL